MKRASLALGLAVLFAVAPTAAAQIPVGGVASDNITYLKNFARHSDTAGGRLHDGFYYVTTERDLSIYDVKDPANPVLVGNAVLDTPGQPVFSEEDPNTNGSILVVSNSLPQGLAGGIYVYNVGEKNNPVLIGQLDGVDEHTMSCVLDCTWVYGSEGAIVDLRDPTAPKLAGNWREVIEQSGSTHDVTEVAPGIVVTSTEPFFMLDVRADPTKPVVLAQGKTPGFMHANLWPQMGKDDMLLVGGEGSGPDCTNNAESSFMTFDARNWASTRTFDLLSEFKMSTGTIVDGKNIESTFCVHWFDTHPSWANGGLLGIAWYEHGARFLKVDSAGKIEEIGYYLPIGGQASDVDWISERIVYVADYLRGIDILEFTGDIPPSFPKPSPIAPPAPMPPAKPVAAGPSFDDLVALPSAKRCQRARKFKVRIRSYRSDPVVAATLRINGRKVASAKGSKLKKGLRVRKLPRKKFGAIVEVTTRSGHKTAGQRTYRVCSR